MRAAATILLAALVAGCGGAPARPNLLLVSIDTLRPDHLGAYGYPRATSPSIDRLAREGVVFERAYSTSNWTLPAHVSMLSGLWPAEHGVLGYRQAIGARVELLAESLGGLGYRSGAVVSAVPFLTGSRGFARGFETYDDEAAYPRPGEPAVSHHLLVTSEAAARRAIELLGALAGQPFFLFLHLFDVHDVYRPPPPYDRMFAAGDGVRLDLVGFEGRRGDLERLAALYDGEIRWVDSWIGEILAELDRRDLGRSTLVLLTADHGEEFLEHGERFHRKNLYDTTLRVPLVLRLPGGESAGRRIATPVSLVDVGATLRAAAGGGEPTWRSGRDLRELLAAEPPAAWNERALHFVGGSRAGDLAGMLAGGRKIVARADARGRPLGGWLRVLPTVDPAERTKVSTSKRERRRLHRQLLAAWQEQQRRHRPRPAAIDSRAAAEEAPALRALGYL